MFSHFYMFHFLMDKSPDAQYGYVEQIAGDFMTA